MSPDLNKLKPQFPTSDLETDFSLPATNKFLVADKARATLLLQSILSSLESNNATGSGPSPTVTRI